jgi:hypothetical protein
MGLFHSAESKYPKKWRKRQNKNFSSKIEPKKIKQFNKQKTEIRYMIIIPGQQQQDSMCCQGFVFLLWRELRRKMLQTQQAA